MKKLHYLVVASLLISLSGCTSKPIQTSPETSVAPIESNSIESSQETEEPATKETEARRKPEALEDLGAEKGLFDVTLTIPAEFVGETTQEELNATTTELGFKSITLNDDGSATYIMTKSQHKEMMKEISNNIHSSLNDLVASEEYPNFTDISVNKDFTEFKIATKSKELDLGESFSLLVFYTYGGMYSAFNGVSVDNISVTFVNADSGGVISSFNSSDME